MKTGKQAATKQWLCPMVSSGESSILEQCKSNGGLNVRIFEFSLPITKSAKHSNEVKKFVTEKYGHIGKELVSILEESEFDDVMDYYITEKNIVKGMVIIMSNRLGAILSKGISNDNLDDMRYKYGFDLIKIENKSMKKFLNEDEDFYIFNKYGEETGISKYNSYKNFYLNMDEHIRVCGIDSFYMMKFEKDQYIKDAAKWQNIIFDIKYRMKIDNFGIINFYENNLTELNEFSEIKRKIIPLKEVDVITLMKLEFNTIYIFI